VAILKWTQKQNNQFIQYRGKKMSLNIINANDEIKINRIVGLLYGFPGSGKTSTANTSNNPITLDFDNGSHRSGFRKDVIRIDRWEDIQSDMKQFFKVIDKYDTVIIDTISTCLEYIGEYIVRNDPKLGRNKLRFYGELKDVFGKFVQSLKTNGKDLIFIAQVKEKEENGVSIKRPDITGGSYDIVTSLCDFIGYQYYKDKIRELDFDPTEEYIGKNPMSFDKIDLPNFATEPDFFTHRVEEIKERLGNISQEQKDAADTVKNLILEIKSVKSVDDLNTVVSDITNADYPKAITAQLRESISNKMKEIDAHLNKETGKYELNVKEEPKPNKEKKSTKPKAEKAPEEKKEVEEVAESEKEEEPLF
jgi:hypothetical protein